MDKELIKKLKIKSGHSLLVLNSPQGYINNLPKADVKITSGKKYDFVHFFVADKASLDKFAPKALHALKPDSLLWIAYPKKNSLIKTDINRDYGWETLHAAGYEPVALIAVNETWSALRFKQKEEAGTKKRTAVMTARQQFTAILEKPDDGIDGAYISIPFDVEKVYGSKGQVKVKAWFDGYPYRGVLANMGTGCHIIIVRKDIRQAIGKNPGDKITIELEQDVEERVVVVPDDLKKALSQSPKAEAFFSSLSYTNRKEYVVWITSAKKAETRESRLSNSIKKLLQGKKNPAQK